MHASGDGCSRPLSFGAQPHVEVEVCTASESSPSVRGVDASCGCCCVGSALQCNKRSSIVLIFWSVHAGVCVDVRELFCLNSTTIVSAVAAGLSFLERSRQLMSRPCSLNIKDGTMLAVFLPHQACNALALCNV